MKSFNQERSVSFFQKGSGGDAVALDIGTSYLKLGVVKNREGLKAVEFARRPASPESLITLLKEWVEKHNLWKKPTFTSLSGPEVNIQYLPLPEVPKKELPSAVRIEAEQILGESLEEMDSDFFVMRQGREKKVLFVSVPKVLTDQRISFVQEAGLRPAGITLDSLALGNAFLASEKPEKGTLVLNIGHRTSNIAVVERENVLFVREVFWGIERIVKEITSTTNFDTQSVFDIFEKRKYSMINLQPYIEKASSFLLEELEKTVTYLATIYFRVKKLSLVGGGSQIPFLPEFIAERLGIPLFSWNPLRSAGLPDHQRQGEAAFFALVAGLSLEREPVFQTKEF